MMRAGSVSTILLWSVAALSLWAVATAGPGSLKVYDNTFHEDFMQLLGSEMKHLQSKGTKTLTWMPLLDACDADGAGKTGCAPGPPRCASEQAVLVLREALEAAGHDTSEIVGAAYGVKWLEAQEEASFGYVQTMSAAHVKKRKKKKPRPKNGKKPKKDPKSYITPAFSSFAYLSNGSTPAVVLDQVVEPNGRSQEPALPSKGWVVFPKRNKHVLFSGDLHHGMPVLRADGGSADGPMIVFVVTWWTERPSKVAVPFVKAEDLPDSMAKAWNDFVKESAPSMFAAGERSEATVEKAALTGDTQESELKLAMPMVGAALHVELPGQLGASDFEVEWTSGQRRGLAVELDYDIPEHKQAITNNEQPVAVLLAPAADWMAPDTARFKVEFMAAAENTLLAKQRDGLTSSGAAADIMRFFVVDPESRSGAKVMDVLKVPEDRLPTVAVLYNTIQETGLGDIQMLRKDRQFLGKSVPLTADKLEQLFEFALSGGESRLPTAPKKRTVKGTSLDDDDDEDLDVEDEDEERKSGDGGYQYEKYQENPSVVTPEEAARAIYNVGLKAANEGNLTRAAMDWVASIKQYPLLGPPYAALAQYHQMEKDYDNAEQLYEMALNINPLDQTSMYNAGNLFFRKEPPQYKEAVKFYRRAYELGPTDAMAVYNCAVSLKSLNRLREQVHYLEIGAMLNPKMVADLQKAREHLEKNPDSPVGDLHDADLGEEEEAPKRKRKRKRKKKKARKGKEKEEL